MPAECVSILPVVFCRDKNCVTRCGKLKGCAKNIHFDTASM